MQAIDLIIAERKKQTEKWSSDHDKHHEHGELSSVAGALCLYGTDAQISDPIGFIDRGLDVWGLCDKHRNNRQRQLIIAGALIVAELERLYFCNTDEVPDDVKHFGENNKSCPGFGD